MQWLTCSRWPTAEVRAPAELCYTVRSHGCGVVCNWHWALFPNLPLWPVAEEPAGNLRLIRWTAQSKPQRLKGRAGDGDWGFGSFSRTWTISVAFNTGCSLSFHFIVICKKWDFTPPKCEEPQFTNSMNSGVLAGIGLMISTHYFEGWSSAHHL